MSKQYKGIDISFFQGDVDFAKVQNAGIDFVIIRASQGRLPDYNHPYVDRYFKQNVESFAKTKGKFYAGTYHLLAARTIAEAEQEAEFYISLLKPYRDILQLWATCDVEYHMLPQNYNLLTSIVKRFCDMVRDAGFRPMVYSTRYWMTHYFAPPANVPQWEAAYSRTTFPTNKAVKIWQKGAASVPGVNGAVDYNLAYDIMGDVNGDGNVNAKDVTTLMKYIASPSKYKINALQADFNRDGKINAKDLNALMKSML